MFISAVCNMSCRRMNGRIETFLGRRFRPMFEVLIPSKYTDPAWENMPRSGTAVYDMSEDVCLYLCEHVSRGPRSEVEMSIVDGVFSILETV